MPRRARLRRLRGPAGKLGGDARAPPGAVGDQRADAAGRALRGADGGAEVHQRLRVLAGPRGRGQRRGELDEARLGGGQRVSIAKSRAITRSTLPSTTTARPAEGDRRHRRGGMAPTPGSAGAPPRVGEAAAESRATTRAQARRLRARA